ncbi:MAG: ATP-dependent zinc metalloprotease FtsH [Desulfofustis sp.]|jgi:cell division protease FtsH|nr:ATP-dependent zinc metalloprotease FtsH [Desulfofustis sp.]
MKPDRLTMLYALSICLLAVVGYLLFQASVQLPERPYSTFLNEVENGDITEVTIRSGEITATGQGQSRYTTFSPDVPELIPLLRKHDIVITTRASHALAPFFQDMLIILLLMGGWMVLSRKRSGATSIVSSGRNRHKPAKNGRKVTFDDVAGISEAQEELKELSDFLKNPEKYSRLGGRIPKGVLLEGPPGTGKTLLAKAIAGEASVPFFSMGGSDFVEMFAGLGASRVRKLFEDAKRAAPCIIFIDEIDAIGGKRSSSDFRNGSNDEREQTLNALLVEMDGFATGETIIVVAATNRSDILDEALLRPGRFDRRITLTLPDIKGRTKILQVHSTGTFLSPAVDLAEVARSTPGFSGAELANLVNEAALMAAKKGKNAIEQVDFDDARDKILMGLERKNAVISENARRLTAYHEAGHAVVAKLLPETDPLHKITIIPRGHSLGLTQQLPLDDYITYTETYLINRIKILLGGRIAEELIFGRMTTGASNDLRGATDIAHRLICEFGMGRQLGPVVCTDGRASSRDFASTGGWRRSEQTLREIDMEIRRLIQKAYRDTKELVGDNSEFLHMIAESLLAHETLDGEEVDIVYRCFLNRLLVEEKQMVSGQFDTEEEHAAQ